MFVLSMIMGDRPSCIASLAESGLNTKQIMEIWQENKNIGKQHFLNCPPPQGACCSHNTSTLLAEGHLMLVFVGGDDISL